MVKQNDKSKHIPVLESEIIEFLQPRPNQDFVDVTLGGGGHARAILDRTGPRGKILAFDLDPQALDYARQSLQQFAPRIIFINENYTKLKTKVDEFKFYKISGIICDLGYSSLQIEARGRGFSYSSEGYLDLRYNPEITLTADKIINSWSEDRLVEIFREFGEEPLAAIIAKTIVADRKKTKIDGQGLRKIIERVYARKWHAPSRTHPATRVWQALRIAVNDEFVNLKSFLPQAIDVLAPGGRLAVISFHSGEDRIVKNFIKSEAKDCICPKETPKCICNHKARVRIITKKPIEPTAAEIRNNPRSRSAKLRVVEKVINHKKIKN